MGALPTDLRFGIEEEFLLVHPESRDVVPRAGEVVARAKAELGQRVSGELTHLQLETRTGICTSVKEALEQLQHARSVLAQAAVDEGGRIVATGSPVLAGAVPPPITEGERQDRGNATFRGLHDDVAICALHVHVEVPDREMAVRISNRLRPWLPVLNSLTVNSPFWSGRDTGYSSWRTMTWSRWPVAGPPPVFTSAAHYDEIVATMLTAGAAVDVGTIFWDVRPSASHPTLEIRVADIPITAQESALFAAIVRALVIRLSDEDTRGMPVPAPQPEILRTAYWLAARDGLEGSGLDPVSGLPVPGRVLAERLFATVSPTLQVQGEHDLVAGWFRQLLDQGTGALRQRTAFAAQGDLRDVIDYLITHTA